MASVLACCTHPGRFNRGICMVRSHCPTQDPFTLHAPLHQCRHGGHRQCRVEIVGLSFPRMWESSPSSRQCTTLAYLPADPISSAGIHPLSLPVLVYGILIDGSMACSAARMAFASWLRAAFSRASTAGRSTARSAHAGYLTRMMLSKLVGTTCSVADHSSSVIFSLPRLPVMMILASRPTSNPACLM